jgi:hypothetical protein
MTRKDDPAPANAAAGMVLTVAGFPTVTATDARQVAVAAGAFTRRPAAARRGVTPSCRSADYT